MKLETTKEKVLEAASKCPQAKTVLETIFPEIFEDDKKFCEIGSLFFRRTYTNNIYAVVKHKNRIVVLNINYSALWSEKKVLPIRDLKDPNGEYITIAEFKKLTGYVNLDEFMVINKPNIHKLRNIYMLNNF